MVPGTPRSLRCLSLVALLAAAVLAITAGPAQAAIEFTTENEPAVVKAEAVTAARFNFGGFTSECQKATFSGTQAAETESTLTTTFSYGECKVAFGVAATVTPHHCAYLLEATTNEAEKAPVKIECATGETIEIASSICTITIGEQTPGGGIHYVSTTGASFDEVSIEIAITGMKYTSSGLCGNGTFTAEYTGKMTAKGYEDTGSPLSGTEKTTPSFKTGAQVGVWAEVVRAYRSTNNPAIPTGSALQQQKFGFAGGNEFKCNAAVYSGAAFAGGASRTLTIEPTYLECTGLGGFVTEEIKEEGCEWKLLMPFRKAGVFTSKVKLVCPAGKALKVTAVNGGGVVQCELLIKEQTAKVFTYANVADEGNVVIRVTPALANLAYEVTKKEAGCQLPAVGNYAGGTLTGQFKLGAGAVMKVE